MRRIAIALAVCALGSPGVLLAQTPPTPPPAQTPPAPQAPAPVPFPADAKIGFINLQFVVAQSKLGKAGTDEMKALQDKKNTELTAKQKEIQTLQQKMQQQTGVLADASLAAMNKELDRLQREFQFLQQQTQADVESLNAELLNNFLTRVQPIIEEVRKERDLWVIFNLEDSGAAAIHAGLDLSAEVVKRLDAVTKAPRP